MRPNRRRQPRTPQTFFRMQQTCINRQEQELEFWRSYARELEGTFDGLENRLIALEHAQHLENRKN